MNKILTKLILIFLVLSISVIPQNWEWKRPKAGSNNFYTVASATENIWMVGGEMGTLFRTTDYGETWTQIFNSVGNASINLMTFANSNIGFAVSQSDFDNSSAKVLKTTNSGLSWTEVATFENFVGDRIQFFDAQNGYINTSYLMKRTTDGGLTWHNQTHPISGFSFDMYFPSVNIGYAVGDETVFKTTNGGTTWTAIHNIPTFLYSIHFTDNNTGYVVGSNMKVYKTSNGGTTWNVVLDSSPYLIYSVHASPVNANFIAIAGESIVYESTNAGNTWSSHIPNANGSFDYRFHSIRYFNNDKVIAVSNYGNIYAKTSNGWVLKQDWIRENINSIFFVTTEKGFAADSKGGIYSTLDGGDNWARFEVPYFQNNSFSKIYFTNRDKGFAFGTYDTLLYTTNGGITWNKSHIAGYNYIWDVHFPTRDIGYAVGQAGTIYKSINGGISWFVINTNISFNINSVFFLNESIGFCGSLSAGLWKTTNGGVTWSVVNDQVSVREITFPNALVGYATAGGPSLLKTTNGGNTWSILPFPLGSTVNSLVFANENIGYAVCVGGRIYKTTNGGVDWTNELSGVGTNDQSLNDVFLKYNGYFFAVGNRGSFIQSRAPEQMLAGVNLRIMNATGSANDTVTVDIKLENPARRLVYDTEQGITNFKPLVNYLRIDTSNTLIGNNGWSYNVGSSEDTIFLSALGNTVSSADNIFYRIKFFAPSNNFGIRTLQFVNPKINDGRIPVSTINGTITINPLNPVTLRILDATGTAGDTVFLSVRLENPSQRQLTSTDIIITNYTSLVSYLALDTVGTLLGRKQWNISASSTEDAFYLVGNGNAITEPDSLFFRIKFLARQNVSGQTVVEFFRAHFNNNTVPVIRQSGTLTIRPRLQSLWQSSAANGNLPSWFGTDTERGIGFGRIPNTESTLQNRLLVVSRAANNLNVRVLNPINGSEIGTLNLTGISGGTFAINDVGISDDGKIFVCNMTTNANTTAFKVYMWNSETSVPVQVINYLADASNAVRLGDKFTVIGDYSTGSVVIWAASSTTGEYKVYKWTMSGGVFNNQPEIISLGGGLTGGIASASVWPLSNGNFYWNANGQNLRKYSQVGTLIGIVPNNVIPTGTNAVRYLGNIGNDEFIAVFAYGSGNNNVIIARLPMGNPADAVLYTTSPSLGSLTNTNGTGDLDIKVNTDFTVDIFVLATNNGIGLYTTSASIPVELVDFTARSLQSAVELQWITSTEKNNLGFEIERKRNDSDIWVKVAFVRGNGTTTTKNIYTYFDNNLSQGKYHYRLKQIDFDGSFTYSNIVEANLIPVENFNLEQNYPNPFNPETNILFSLPIASNVSIKLYDLNGREVKTLINREMEAGVHFVKLNAEGLASGIYLYRIIAGSYSATKKLMLLK
jgi:photosystem II stability/assembly factor-like uncharacterized protein